MERQDTAAKQMAHQNWEVNEWFQEDNENEHIDPWTRLQEKTNMKNLRKIRKPVQVVNWFGDEPRDSSELSNDSTETEEKWTEVERKRRNTLKRRKRRAKRLNRMEEVATKMQHMIGVSPIPENSVEFFMVENGTVNDARKKAVKEYLGCYL